MAMTYETITPFLKGLHMMLALFLPQQDKEGWKLLDCKWLDYIRSLVKEGKLTPQEGLEAAEVKRQA